jgi:hypothetical protein
MALCRFASSPPARRSRGVLAACAALLGGLVLLPAPGRTGAAADSPPARKAPPEAFECRWADTPIKIDGLADEEAWKHAQVIDYFYLPWLGPKARPARTATKARLLWDREYLYFFADMEDTDLYADEKEHDGVTWDNDVFELFFKPAADKLPYYEFQVNAANTPLELFLPSRGSGGYRRFAPVTRLGLESAVRLRGTLNRWEDKDRGWTVEGRIPWTAFKATGGRPPAGATWRFALCRYDYSAALDRPELSSTAPLTQPDFHRYEDYGELTFVGAGE